MSPPNTAAMEAVRFAHRALDTRAPPFVPPANWRAVFASAEGPVPPDLLRRVGLPIGASWFQLAERLALNIRGSNPINL